MNQLLKDLGYGFRQLWRAPAFAAVAIVTLALGIGAATSVWSVVHAVLLRSLPFAGQDRLAVLWEVAKTSHSGLIELSYPDYRDWRDQNRVFSGLAALTSSNLGMNLTGAGAPLQVQAAPVSANFFSVLGVRPLVGRAFLAEDDRRGARPVVVLSGGLWREMFGSDPHIVGRELRLDGQGYTVAGVMPAGFNYPRDARLWIPLVPQLGEQSESHINRVIKAVGRLRPGVEMAQARAAIEVIAARLEQLYDADRGTSSSVAPLADEIVGEARPILIVLLAGVLLLLLIALANVANLLLARALDRRHEIGVRAALGAGRGRLVRQLLTEGLALGVLGGAGGLALALLGIRLLRTQAPDNLPRLDEIGLDLPTLLFAVVVSLVAVIACGLVPALDRGADLQTALREGGKRTAGSVRSGRLSRLLVRGEVAIAVVLLIATGLTLRSMASLQRIDPGFLPDHVLTARIQLPATTYPDAHQRQLFFDRLLDRAAALPGVTSAAMVLSRPLDDSATWEVPIAKEGQTLEEREANPLPNFEAVSPGYFHTLGIRLLAGTDFSPADTATSRLVAIVSQDFAAHFWPGQSPIGKRVRRFFRGPADQKVPWLTVIGLAADVHYRGWGKVMPDLYVPAQQNPIANFMTNQDLVLRTRVDPASLAGPVRDTVRSLDANQAVASFFTLDGLVGRGLAAPRFTMEVMVVSGTIALCLALVGIYGLLSYTVGQRTREIGIRMAVGARQQEILSLVVTQGLLLILGGVAVGLAAALVLTRFMASLLHGVSIRDPLTFVAVPLLLAVAALGATFLPARRAARANPTTALRS